MALRSTLPPTLAVSIPVPATSMLPALAVMLPTPPLTSAIGPRVSWSPGNVAISELTSPIEPTLIVTYWEVVGEPGFW